MKLNEVGSVARGALGCVAAGACHLTKAAALTTASIAAGTLIGDASGYPVLTNMNITAGEYGVAGNEMSMRALIALSALGVWWAAHRGAQWMAGPATVVRRSPKRA